MRLRVDSHALIWYVDQDHLLSPALHTVIDVNVVQQTLIAAANCVAYPL